jgi:anaerobic magnesium-protoporphyrin IX monomethyl ester cyclase
MAREVPQVKLVDRTFNSDPARARAIFAHILAHNRTTRFHFEIAAHLLDEATLALLDTVPPGCFQFEIGVQSTADATLRAIDRPAALERLEAAVRRLVAAGRVHLHLDLVAGLPGEEYPAFLDSIDRVAALRPDHLQVELVKLLPGTPLRAHAQELGLSFDPHPPYTVLATPQLNYAGLERLRGISRLLDLTFNAGCFATFLAALGTTVGSLARGLERLAEDQAEVGWLRHPLSRSGLFIELAAAVGRQWPAAAARLRDALAFDLAKCERIVAEKAPSLFDTRLTPQERDSVAREVRQAIAAVRGRGIKLQHFAATFRYLPATAGRCVVLFLYRIESGMGMTVEERRLGTLPPGDESAAQAAN